MENNIDVVFIDTSIYVSENFFDKNNRINSLFELALRKRLSIISTQIVNQEILEHFSTSMHDAYTTISKKCKILKNEKSLVPLFKSIQDKKKKEIQTLCKDILEKNFRRAQVVTIGYEYSNNVEEIFTKYFNDIKPFSEGVKKHEFPDAFSLQALENYCKRTGLKKIIILSNDKDLQNFQSNYLEYRDLKTYVSQKFTDEKYLLNLETNLVELKDDLIYNITEDVELKLNDISLYNSYCGYSDISDFSVTECTVDFTPDDYYITNHFKTNIQLEINPTITYEVELTYQDLSAGYYDKEDHCYYGDEWITETISREITLTVTLNYDIERKKLDINNYEIDLDNIADSI